MLISAPVQLPGNASRYFDDPVAAAAQPLGQLGITASVGKHVHNALFAPELIRYDASYLTTSCELTGGVRLLTLEYFPEVLRHFPQARPSVCDVGCGQGEFVTALRDRGIGATGFDPVLREPNQYLHQDYWTPEDPEGDADLLVMRCVLPHISQPWDWLEAAATRPRHVLIEYQRIEWLVKQSVWYGMNHDHVNYFRIDDFAARHQVVDSGRFADDEWAWVLIRIGSGSEPDRRLKTGETATDDVLRGVEDLARARSGTIDNLRHLDRPVILWGAAGKGIVAADSLRRHGVSVVTATDLDPNKWGKFLEASAIEVVQPARLLSGGGEEIVVVSNPRHVDDVRKLFGPLGRDRILSLSRGI